MKNYSSYEKKNEVENASTMLEIIKNLEAGWSFNMAAAKSKITYEYATYLRKKYPEFDMIVVSMKKQKM